MKERIVILGAGKIGRGFVADIFDAAGYGIVFADSSAELIRVLNAQGYYTLYNVRSTQEQEKKTIRNFTALEASDPALPELIQKTGLLAVVVFPDAFDAVAKMLAGIVEKKHAEQDKSPLNVIVLANIVAPQKLLREKIYTLLPHECRAFAEHTLGLAGSIVLRIAVQPTAEMLLEDALTVLTDGHDILPLEDCLIGARPSSPNIEYHESLDALELRKLYTYNMAHAATAYLGSAKSCATIAEALNDPEIELIVRGALEEVSGAFVREYNFSEAEMQTLCDGVIKKFKNPLLMDLPGRVGLNPIRKLKNSDRLIGAALLARKNGIYPYYLLKAAAYGLMFYHPTDPASAEIHAFIQENGIDAAIAKYTGLHEADVKHLIKRHYLKADGQFVAEDGPRVAFLHRAFSAGFRAEKNYRGCAQGALMGLSEVTGIKNKDLFRAATGFSGGMALCGDGVCGGYSGGVLFMGYLLGRDLDRIPIDGDKENQYIAYDCAQRLHDLFMDCYNSPICMRIHEGMFGGEHYILRTKPRRDEFEEAGAHTVVCTTVVGLSCVWVMEILMDKGIYTMKQEA